MRNEQTKATSGFTLLEVMIASGILFLCLFAILQLLSVSLRNARVLQRTQVDAGKLASQGADPVTIGLARKVPKKGSEVITIVSMGMPFKELYLELKEGSDFPFVVMQLTVNQKGEGNGILSPAAKLKFKGDKPQVQSLGNKFIQVSDVKRVSPQG